MKKATGLILFSIVLCSCFDTRKHQNDITVVRFDKYIWLDGSYESLMDNALRCFGLHSIGSPGDSSIRLWNSEAFYPDSSKLHFLNMVELCTKSVRPYAIYYNLEYKAGVDSQCIVTCVRRKSVVPKNGWTELKNKMEELKLNRIDTIPDRLDPDNIIMEGDLKALQYVYGETTTTVDFTIYDNFSSGKSQKLRSYYNLIKLVKDEFSINLFADHFGYDLFKIYPD